jgi:hypothetical protein
MDLDLLKMVTQAGLGGPAVALIAAVVVVLVACWNSHDRRREVEALLRLYEHAKRNFDLPSALAALRPYRPGSPERDPSREVDEALDSPLCDS